MSRTARYIVRAEDLAGRRFLESYLRSVGVDLREVRSESAPPGRGSGKQWVDAQYPIEVRALRTKRPGQKVLLVTTDADELTVAERKRRLADALANAALTPRTDAESIAVVIPRWEIETWAEHVLTGASVSEDARMGWDVAKSERDCHAAGGKLAEHRSPGPACCPPSLVAVDGELARVTRR